ncbi:MAG TPA: hypothetical protein VIM97_12190 [Actinomycetes bacterium]
MYLVSPQEMAIQHITELHQRAAAERLAREAWAGRRPATRRRRSVWRRLRVRQPRPAGA